MTDNFVTYKDMAELVEKFDKKLDAQSKTLMEYFDKRIKEAVTTIGLYTDNKVISHTRDILDNKYAPKCLEVKVEQLEKEMAKEVIENAATFAKDKVVRAENKAKQEVANWKIGVIWAIIGTAIGIAIQIIIKINFKI